MWAKFPYFAILQFQIDQPDTYHCNAYSFVLKPTPIMHLILHFTGNRFIDSIFFKFGSLFLNNISLICILYISS